MAKDKTVYVCDQCGHESSKWIGKCPSCGQWNTFKEFVVRKESSSSAGLSALKAFNGGGDGTASKPLAVHEIETAQETRIDTTDAELNRVLGGGLVPGSLVLLGGEPGIG